MSYMTLWDVKRILDENQTFDILVHKNPDGDTLGSGFALCRVLRNMGKRANILTSDGFPPRYAFLYDGYEEDADVGENTDCVIAVDIADTVLMGRKLEKYTCDGAVDLCIDHHISNRMYAKQTLLDGSASATALILYRLFKETGIVIDRQTAVCLYTGIATDTGCFKYENTTPEAHIAAAELMGLGLDYADINRRMFDLRTKSRLAVEQLAMSKIEYDFGGRMSMIVVTKQMIDESGADEAEFDGLAALPLNIEGVDIGITVKQRDVDRYKLSVRTNDKLNASEFCKGFGGGGHIRAAGCEICGALEDVKSSIRAAVKELLESGNG